MSFIPPVSFLSNPSIQSDYEEAKLGEEGKTDSCKKKKSLNKAEMLSYEIMNKTKEGWVSILNQGHKSEHFIHYENQTGHGIIRRIALYICPKVFANYKQTYLCVNCKKADKELFQNLMNRQAISKYMTEQATVYEELDEVAFSLAKPYKEFQTPEVKNSFIRVLYVMANSAVFEYSVPLAIFEEMKRRVEEETPDQKLQETSLIE